MNPVSDTSDLEKRPQALHLVAATFRCKTRDSSPQKNQPNFVPHETGDKTNDNP